MSDNEIELLGDHGRLLLQQAVAKEIKAVVDASKAACMVGMQPGDRRTVTYGDVKLGSVTLTEPTKQATVTVRAQFELWVGNNHPTELSDGWELVPGATVEDLIEQFVALAEGAGINVDGGIVRRVSAVNPAFETRVLDEVSKGGAPVPGVEVSSRAPWLVVKPSADALVQARSLIAGQPMPELAGGAE